MMGKNKPKPAWKVFSVCVQLETFGKINPLIWYGHVEIKKNEFKINKILHGLYSSHYFQFSVTQCVTY
jgi:hypothetical protein